MNFLNNEKGVSEIIGALLILLILVAVLGTIQVYEVPKWNKEIERQQFDKILDDFLFLKSNFQLMPTSNMPLSNDIHMGVKYPERFMLSNPGEGAYGTLTYEKMNVTIKINNGTTIPKNSSRIIYKMNGLSNLPTLVYENGLLIRDFGNNKSLIEGNQTIISGNDVFLPIFNAEPQSVSSLEHEILDLLPTEKINLEGNTLNITLETKYPDVWRKLKNDSNLDMKVVPVNNNSGIIYINRSIKWLSYPNNSNGSSGLITTSSGLITTKVPEFELGDQNQGGLPKGPTGPKGAYSNEVESMNRVNIPASDQIQKFVISDLAGTTDSSGKYFVFSVTGQNASFFLVKITMGGILPPNIVPVTAKADIYYENTAKNEIFGTLIGTTGYRNISEGINLTDYYYYAGIPSINSLRINIWDDRSTQDKHDYRSYILYTKFVICSKTEPC